VFVNRLLIEALVHYSAPSSVSSFSAVFESFTAFPSLMWLIIIVVETQRQTRSVSNL